MKNKKDISFYYSTFRMYEKDLNDRLTEDFQKSDKQDKTSYLLELISLGLNSKKYNSQPSAKPDFDLLTDKLSEINQKLDTILKEILLSASEGK